MKNNELYNHFKQVLSKQGLKLTPQRINILNEVIENHDHRECEEIYLDLKSKQKKVSRATVYRTMEILVQNGFARKLELGDGRARYENKVDIPHHDHLICTSCGKIIEFMDEQIEQLQDKIAEQNKFTLSRHIHQLFGICNQCQ